MYLLCKFGLYLVSVLIFGGILIHTNVQEREKERLTLVQDLPGVRHHARNCGLPLLESLRFCFVLCVIEYRSEKQYLFHSQKRFCFPKSKCL